MTGQEVCKQYGCSLSSLETNFNRTAASILKKYGIRLYKVKQEGIIQYVAMEDDKRALTIFEETKEIFFLDAEAFTLEDWEFNIFLMIIISPMLVFRGSYRDLLKYMKINVTAANEKHVKKALESLFKKDYIMYTIDKTDNNYFMAGLYRAVEKKYGLGISIVRRSREFAEKYHKQNWGHILKVWGAVQFLSGEVDKGLREYYLVQDISNLTGLSKKQIYEINKILKAEDIYITKYKYEGINQRIGTVAILNEFKNSVILPMDDIEYDYLDDLL